MKDYQLTKVNRGEIMKLINGDCLEEMKNIETGSIDMVLTDPPYGTTACKWDSIIDLPLMWEQLKRIIKPNGAIVMTASQPFTTTLISSNMKMFKYCWVWEKSKVGAFAQAGQRPLNTYEDICIFSYAGMAKNSKIKMIYNAQGIKDCYKQVMPKQANDPFRPNREIKKEKYTQEKTGYPKNILRVRSVSGKQEHPTQKPVALMEYLIKTYTNEGETVLDFTMGSGTTGVACKNLNREFIGIELDKGYFDIAEARINENN
jgi:site-specific DNA-methyltransferase (adenine-specific)